MSKLSALIAGPLLMLAVTTPWVTPAFESRQDTWVGPEHWVAFGADVESWDPQSPAVVGRFYRNASGSTRTETGPAPDDVRVISIQNVSKSVFYNYYEGVGWTSQPMVLPPDGYRPTRYRSAFLPRERVPEGYFGFDAYKVSSERERTIRVPDLNNFAVLAERLDTGARRIYRNIKVEDQPDWLFEPPAWAKVTHSTKPGGIVWTAEPPKP